VKTPCTTAELDSLEVTSATLASLLGVDKRSIQRYATENLAVRLAHGRYRLAQTVRNITGRLREQAAGRIGHDETVDVARANARLKEAQAKLTELKIKQLDGELISLAQVDAAIDEIAVINRQLFLTFPARARADLPHLTGGDQKVLDRIAREMLTEVATHGAVKQHS